MFINDLALMPTDLSSRVKQARPFNRVYKNVESSIVFDYLGR